MTNKQLIVLKVKKLLQKRDEKGLLKFIDDLLDNKQPTLASLKAEVIAEKEKLILSIEATKTKVNAELDDLKS